jgi:hypothetical protein
MARQQFPTTLAKLFLCIDPNALRPNQLLPLPLQSFDHLQDGMLSPKQRHPIVLQVHVAENDGQAFELSLGSHQTTKSRRKSNKPGITVPLDPTTRLLSSGSL